MLFKLYTLCIRMYNYNNRSSLEAVGVGSKLNEVLI